MSVEFHNEVFTISFYNMIKQLNLISGDITWIRLKFNDQQRMISIPLKELQNSHMYDHPTEACTFRLYIHFGKLFELIKYKYGRNVRKLKNTFWSEFGTLYKILLKDFQKNMEISLDSAKHRLNATTSLFYSIY